MTMYLLLQLVFMFRPLACTAQNRPVFSASQKVTASVACQISFKLQDNRFLAETDDGLSVVLLKGAENISIYHFVPEYRHIQGCENLGTITFPSGDAYIAWKWCEGHFCPARNGAVVFNLSNKSVFRLEYEENKGLRLSSDLANPDSNELKAWLLNWWKKWPGRDIPETDIVYTNFDKSQKW
jgi:hypothetical protein